MKNLLITVLAIIAAVTTLTAQQTYKFNVGQYTVYTLSEGQHDGNLDILIDVPQDIVERYIPTGKYPMAVNAFLVKTPSKLILIDAGYGLHLVENIRGVGFRPEEVTDILLTHMHGDHIGGLLDDNGKPVFSRASIFVPEKEMTYWVYSGNGGDSFEKARAVKNAYGPRIFSYFPGTIQNPVEIAGVEAIAAPGHTPGHTTYLLTSGKDKLLIWGDLMHAQVLQVPHPEFAVTYDIDPKMAIDSRKAILDWVTRENIPVAGMHLPYPAAGRLTDGGSKFQSYN